MKKWKIITPVVVAFLLVFAFLHEGNAPEMAEQLIFQEELEIAEETPEIMEIPEVENAPEIEMEEIPEPLVDTVEEIVVAEEIFLEEAALEEVLICTLSVTCHTILENMDLLTEGKEALVPEDGIIFPETEVVFYEGETVFHVLLREMKQAGIHMEYENTPLYNSAYIEGIHNIYEYDCGALSGWMYSVNGWFPNYGTSNYVLKQGDAVEWVYSCELGEDVQF